MFFIAILWSHKLNLSSTVSNLNILHTQIRVWCLMGGFPYFEYGTQVSLLGKKIFFDDNYRFAN